MDVPPALLAGAAGGAPLAAAPLSEQVLIAVGRMLACIAQGTSQTEPGQRH
jgi:hypothetical protein